MRTRFALLALLLLASPVGSTAREPQLSTRMIDAGGLKLRAQISGRAREGQPTVVLVGGLGDGLEVWKQVQSAVGELARVVAYDRAGLGQSEADSAPPTAQRTATQLHTLLQNAGIKPPYVLVGHSLGGPFVRMYAGLYPKEVAGLVYVDPKDFTQTRAGQLALWAEIGESEAGLNSFEKQVEQRFVEAPPAVRAEAEVAMQMDRTGFADFRSLPPLPAIPVVILMAGQADLPANVKLVFGRQRLWSFAQQLAEVPGGTLVLTNRSGHYIHSSEPELVTWAIRRVLSSPAAGPGGR
jgi:pimeloyl-ACP methyl ester carboxylesterase